MAVQGKRGVGLPTLILQEAEATVLTVELKNGNRYTGYMEECEDNWNMLITNATLTRPNGKQSKVQAVYLRGDRIVLLIMPDVMKHAPMFKRVQNFKRGIKAPLGAGRGKAGAIMEKAGRRAPNQRERRR